MCANDLRINSKACEGLGEHYPAMEENATGRSYAILYFGFLLWNSLHVKLLAVELLE